MDYAASLLVTWIAFGVTAAGLSFFAGRSGYLSLLHAGLFGVGAYLNVLILQVAPAAVGFSWLASGVLTSLLAGLLTLPLFRTRADHFVILTLAFQVALTIVLLNWDAVTKGPLGISYATRWPFGVSAVGDIAAMGLVGLAAIVALVFASRSRVGLLLSSIRDSETLMASFGYNVPAIKTLGFALSALVAGVCGAAYGQYVGFIDPTSYRLDESILLLAIVILAGMRGVAANMAAALFVVAAPEAMRFLAIGSTYDANVREIVYGAALVAVVLIRHGRMQRVPPIGLLLKGSRKAVSPFRG